MTTLQRGVTIVTLPDDLLWSNEFAWNAVEVQRRFSIAGALITDVGTKQVGRQITLQGGQDYAWVARADVLTLAGWADEAPQDMTLTYRGVEYTVQFDYGFQQPIAAEPVIDYADPDNTDTYALTLRLIVTG